MNTRLAGLGLVAALFGVGCGPMYGPGPANPTSPQMPAEPINQSGPPGGSADPGYGYADQQAQDPVNSGDLQGYQPGNPNDVQVTQPDLAPTDPYVEPSTDPNSSGYVMGNVNDQEINSTLAPYGDWVDDPEYGRVWRPHATVVGANFTPYESCGTWVYTDYGWTFQACEQWNWGWLPFHYGAWDMIGDSWCWVPDYTWGPGWVDWRGGGGYVGWRPSRPRVRDHRGNNRPDRYVRDHRRDRSSDWRFVREHDLGNRRINSSLVDRTEGLRLTTDVSRPTLRAQTRVNVASVMGSRLRSRVATANPSRGGQPQTRYRAPYRQGQPSYTQPRGYRGNDPRGYQRPNTYGQRPTYDQRQRFEQRYQPRPNDSRYQPRPNYQPRPGYQSRPDQYRPRSNDQRYQPQPDRSAPSRTYREPSRGYDRGSRPQGNYSRPSQPSNSGSYSRSSGSSNSSRAGSSNSGGGSSRSSGSSGGSSRSGGSSGGGSRGGGGRR